MHLPDPIWGREQRKASYTRRCQNLAMKYSSKWGSGGKWKIPSKGIAWPRWEGWGNRACLRKWMSLLRPSSSAIKSWPGSPSLKHTFLWVRKARGFYFCFSTCCTKLTMQLFPNMTHSPPTPHTTKRTCKLLSGRAERYILSPLLLLSAWHRVNSIYCWWTKSHSL